MIRILKFTFLVAVLLLAQITLLPARISDPFKPDLLIIAVAFLALKGTSRLNGGFAFLLGLMQDCFSGLYLGLNGFSFLVIFLILKKIAGNLYADSYYLLLLVVFLATLVNGVIHLFLLVIFSMGSGVYTTLLPALLPQGLVNALAASILAGLMSLKGVEEGR